MDGYYRPDPEDDYMPEGRYRRNSDMTGGGNGRERYDYITGYQDPREDPRYPRDPRSGRAVQREPMTSNEGPVEREPRCSRQTRGRVEGEDHMSDDEVGDQEGRRDCSPKVMNKLNMG